MSEAAKLYFEKKAARKAEKRAASEQLELKRLAEKYEIRPFPITEDPGVPSGEKPFLTLEQMVRLQSLKLDYEYTPLREAGKTHDEAEKAVFPDAYEYRLALEEAQKAEQADEIEAENAPKAAEETTE